MNRRSFMRTAAGAGIAFGSSALPAATPADTGECRNKQAGMHYRPLGKTGILISEFLSGGDPIRLKNYEHLNLAMEMGLNYLDMAPAYGRGECEQAYGAFLGGSAKREKFFLTTKSSGLTDVRNRLYKEIFDGLPGEKQTAIMRRAEQMRADRGVDAPGYYLTYFPNQSRQFEASYISNAMMADYQHRVEGSPEFRKFIVETLEGSLKRVGTDYFDILMCPHGACTPEEIDIAELRRTYEDLKKSGKVRFLGVTSHNDPAGVLEKSAALKWDVVMCAYNVINGGYMDRAVRTAHAAGVGIIAMKAAHAVATHHKALQPVPQWRINKINRIIPGDMKAPLKAYLWALQNPRISAVCSNLFDETFIRENLALAGEKVELQTA